MKFNFLLIVCSLLTFSSCKKEETVTLECLPSHLQNGLIAFYPFNSGSLQDESTQNNDLTNPTAAVPSADRMGNATCAFAFSNTGGNTEFLTTTQTLFLNSLNAFTISAWYAPLDPTRPGGIFEALVSRGNTPRCPDRSGEWSVSLYDCRRAVFAYNNSVWADRVVNNGTCEDEVIALTGAWHHVAAVKSGNTISIYFNGVLQDQVTGDGDCGSSGLHLAQDIGDLFIANGFNGSMDDILIFNRAVSAQEVVDLFSLTACCE